jgi:hypothetical protein
MAVKAAEDSAAAKVAIAEKRRYEEAINLTSEKLYPSLVSVQVVPKTALNFKGVVKAVIAKEEEAEAAEEDDAGEEIKGGAKTKVKGSASTFVEAFMDSFDDDEDEDEEDDEEFNAHTVHTTRRGDKGIW